jgi:hypothetical protein
MAESEQKKLVLRKPEGYFLKKNLENIPESLAKVLINPELKEAQIKVDTDIIIQGIKNPVMAVFIGLSTTALITALKRKKKRIDNIIVIEPRLDVFKELIMTEDVSEYLADPRIDFLVGLQGSELLTELFKVLSKADPGDYLSRVGKAQNMEKIIDPFVYNDLESSKKAQELNKVVDETVQHLILSMGCPDDQSRRWELMVENRHNMFKAWNATSLKEKFDKTNAIVLGGGPTLNEFIEAYHKHPDLKNCLILAADAVLHKLLEADIKPHIIFRCERKKTQIFKGISRDRTAGIYYAAYPWTDPSFFDLFDDHFYLFRHNGVCMFTELKHCFTDGGVSSSNAAFEFAIELGCPNILTAGIDLCMIGGKTHTDGTQVEFNPNNSKEKWSKIKNWKDEDVTTIPVWERCRNEYGQSIDKHRAKGKKFGVYQTALGSGKILGAEYKSWEDCVALCSDKVDVSKRLETYRSKISDSDVRKFYDVVRQAHQDLKDIAEGAKVTIELESDAKRTFDGETDKMFRRMIRECCETTVVNGRAEVKPNPIALIKAFRAIQPNIEKLSKNIADNYDTNFKMKYCNNKFYRMCLMDVLQHDVFLYENKCNSLTNMREFIDEKYLDYAVLTRDFLDRVDYYATKLFKLFEEVLNDEQGIIPASTSDEGKSNTIPSGEAQAPGH